MFHVKRRRDKVRSISSGAQRRIAISLPCPSASPRDPLRWAPVGAPSAQSPLHFIRRCAPDIHSTPLSLRFPTRPAPLGSRGAPSAQSPLHSIRRTAPDIHCTPLSLRFPTRPAPHFSLPCRGGLYGRPRATTRVAPTGLSHTTLLKENQPCWTLNLSGKIPTP